MANILVVDDKESMREVIKETLLAEEHTLDEANNGQDAFKKLQKNYYDLIISDLKMPNMDGLELLKAASKRKPPTALILITAFGTVETAVEAMRNGAYDYITKPFSIDHLRISVRKALERQSLLKENSYLRNQLNPSEEWHQLIGNSENMKKVHQLINKVASTDTPVFIRGESGTGKEVIANAIHHNSTRRNRVFVATSCAVYAEGVLESELFGHEKGSFTGAANTHIGRFEIANGGTLFLDEIGDLNMSLQIKLLRFLQERQFERVGGTKPVKVDVRIIAATNRNIEEKIKNGSFREDLFYRINVFPINLPPLRERRADIAGFARYFLRKYSHSNKKNIKIDPKTIKSLELYSWPGNVRELENVIQHALILTEGDSILPQHLPPEIQNESYHTPKIKGNYQAKIDAFEKQLIISSIRESGGVRSKAAKLLGLQRTSLLYKIKKYRIDGLIDLK